MRSLPLYLLVFAAVLLSGCAGLTAAGNTSSQKNQSTSLLNASTKNLNLGNVPIGNSNVLGVTLTNAGNSNVSISNVSVSGSGFTASGLSAGLTLTPGQTATLNVTLAPAATGGVSGSVTVVSNASNSPAVVTLSGAGIAATVQHSVALSWSSSSSPVIGYFVYRGAISAGPYSKLNSSADPATSYTDTSVRGGQTYVYVVTAVDAIGIESGYSIPVSATIPSP
jgi:hypothetical protein